MKHSISTLLTCSAFGLILSGCELPLAQDAPSCAAEVLTSTAGVGMGVLSSDLGSDEIAQSFYVKNAIAIDQIVLNLVAQAPSGDSLGGTLTLKIEGDSGNAPDGNPIATAQLPVSSITKDASGSYAFSFTSITLSALTRYWIKLNASYNPSNTHLIFWRGNVENIYTSGNAAYKDHASGKWMTWKVPTMDLLFQLGCP